MNAANSSGVLPMGRNPDSVMRARISGVLSMRAISLCKRTMRSCGVPAGAHIACHPGVSTCG